LFVYSDQIGTQCTKPAWLSCFIRCLPF